MKIIRKIIPMMAILLIAAFAQAQQIVNYDYDDTGNMTLRYVSTKKVTEVDSLFSEANQPINLEGEDLVKVYPNPTYGLINVEFSETPENSIQYLLSDQNGRLVEKGEMRGLSNLLDITRHGRGTYFLRITAPEISQLYKIIKQ